MYFFACSANVGTGSNNNRRSVGGEFQTTAPETAKFMTTTTVRIRRTTSFRVSADLR